jgi:hypothetical protein
MSYTSPARPGEPPVPEYRWVPGEPDPRYHYSTGGCYGCDFRRRSDIRCSRIPCHIPAYRNMVAKLVKGAAS